MSPTLLKRHSKRTSNQRERERFGISRHAQAACLRQNAAKQDVRSQINGLRCASTIFWDDGLAVKGEIAEIFAIFNRGKVISFSQLAWDSEPKVDHSFSLLN